MYWNNGSSEITTLTDVPCQYRSPYVYNSEIISKMAGIPTINQLHVYFWWSWTGALFSYTPPQYIWYKCVEFHLHVYTFNLVCHVFELFDDLSCRPVGLSLISYLDRLGRYLGRLQLAADINTTCFFPWYLALFGIVVMDSSS